MNGSPLPPSRLALADLPRVGSVGLRTRRLRAALSGLGIAIGIASMVAVLGISESSKADLIAELDRLGTNLLTVGPGQSFLGEDAALPESAPAAITRIKGVEVVAAIKQLDASVRRTDRIPEEETGGISVLASDPSLASALGAKLSTGTFLSRATARYPTVVLGAIAARRLGIVSLAARPRVHLGGRWFTVVGILRPAPLASDIDSSALIGFDAAATLFGAERDASQVYVRTAPDAVTDVRAVLGATANPEFPEEVQVSRPSDALAARIAAKDAFTALFFGLGAVALLVGGVGIANVMFVSVLERRSEIGLRRALGATQRHVAAQFLCEALLLSGGGGVAGAALGAMVTGGYALSRDWLVVVPAAALGAGIGAALLIGAVAGLYPALRAARMSPTEALRAA